MLFTRNGVINIRNNKWADDFSPVDPEGSSFVDHQYTKAYLRHLFQAGEMLGPMIGSIHNLAFYLWLVDEARIQIIQGTFRPWKEQMVIQMRNRL